MNKQLNYLMIAKQLTGNSSVFFYATPELAKKAFDNCTKPLITVCSENGCEPDDEQKVLFLLKDGKGIKFIGGELDELDDLFIGGSDVYYEWGSIAVADDVTHYVAEFSNCVDKSSITFYTKNDAVITYNNRIDDGIQIANDNHGSGINRYDQSTWECKDRGIVFREAIDTSINYSDAFFRYSDTHHTYRCGEIEVMDVEEYTIIATGGRLKRPKIYTFTIDPTDPDTLAEIADSESFNEYVEYILEEEEAGWSQRFVNCNIIPKDQMDNILKQDEEEGGK